jgi:predicted outer membrane protein
MSAKRFLGALVAVLLMVLAGAGIALADDVPAGPAQQTPLGEITDLDKELLVKVRQAGLWEMPMGDEAQTRAAAQRVKDVGKQLASDHAFLDERVMKLSTEMGVPLPTEANPDQQSWMAELRSKTGKDFDEAFANRLRAAHGKVFTAVAKVRAGTRNEAIRQFAQVCVNIVMKHMTLLESTNLVTEPGLSEPVNANAVAGGPTLQSSQQTLPNGMPSPLVIALICAAGVAVSVGLLRLLRDKRPVR